VIGREANAIYSFALGKISTFIPQNDYLSQQTQKSVGTKLLKTKEKLRPILYG
jgi:hypothetical protein